MWELAFTHKALAVSACTLSVISVVVSFMPFIAIYYIIRELAMNMSDLSGLDGGQMIRLTMSVISLVQSVFVFESLIT